MNRRAVGLAAAWLVLGAPAWGGDLCGLVRDVSRHVAVDARAEDYRAFGDAYTGATESWREVPGAWRYRGAALEAAATAPLGPRELLERLWGLDGAVRTSPAFADERPNGPYLRGVLARQLAAVRAEVLPLLGAPELDWAAARSFVGTRWDRVQVASATCDGWEYATATLYFSEQEPRTPLALQIVPFDGMDPDPDRAIYLADPVQAAEFRVVVDEVNRLFQPFRLAALNRAVERLDEIDAGWSNYLTKGYSQYPWESLVNSSRRLNSYTWSSPPKRQFLLLHPEVAAVVDARSTRGAAVEGGLLLHGLGYLRYFGAKRSWFLGCSVTGAVTGSPDVGLGAGGTLHFGHSALHARVPHVSLSALFHDTRSGSSGPFLGFSVDLWRLFEATSNEELYRAALSGASGGLR